MSDTPSTTPSTSGVPNTKDLVQSHIDHHRAHAERLIAEKNTTIERLKAHGAFDGAQLTAYGNVINKIDNELREHTRVIATLGIILKQV